MVRLWQGVIMLLLVKNKDYHYLFIGNKIWVLDTYLVSCSFNLATVCAFWPICSCLWAFLVLIFNKSSINMGLGLYIFTFYTPKNHILSSIRLGRDFPGIEQVRVALLFNFCWAVLGIFSNTCETNFVLQKQSKMLTC